MVYNTGVLIVAHTPIESRSIYHSDLLLGMRLSCSKNSKYFGLCKEMLLTQIKAQHDPLLGQGSIQISQTLGGKNCTFKEQTARIVRLHGLRHAPGWKRSCVVTLNFFCRSAQLAVVNQNIFQLSSPVELGFMKYLIFGLICCHIFDRFGRLMSSLVNALCI